MSLWDKSKSTNGHIMGVPEDEKKKLKTYSKKNNERKLP